MSQNTSLNGRGNIMPQENRMLYSQHFLFFCFCICTKSIMNRCLMSLTEYQASVKRTKKMVHIVNIPFYNSGMQREMKRFGINRLV